MNQEKSDLFLDYFDLRSPSHDDEVSDSEFDKILNDLDGELDAKAATLHRKEQSKLRKYLLKGRPSGTCLLCGLSMSATFLIAGHIKKRSLCSPSEKRDFAGNTMLVCRFGCDYLFEEGFVAVDASKSLVLSSRLSDKVALKYIQPLVGRLIGLSEHQENYFAWHQSNRFIK